MDLEGGAEITKGIERESTLEARTVEMEYVPGGNPEVVQFTKHGIRRSSDDPYADLEPLKDKIAVRGGFGSYVYVTPSHYILTVEVDGEKHELWTERDFRKALNTGRLTPRTRQDIESVMPEEVKVVLKIGQRGTKYYRLADESVDLWAAKIRETYPKRGYGEKPPKKPISSRFPR